jgi:imidazolonepropionase
MILIHNAKQLITVASFGESVKRGEKQGEIFLIENGSVLIKDEKIEWVGRAVDFNFGLYDDVEIFDATGKVVMPGFVDSHTHLVFAGTREDEFNLRIKGFTYQQIAEMGGGIVKTVEMTRKADKKQLFETAKNYAEKALSFGTTTIEIKSGYGLNLDDEVKILEVVKELNGNPLLTIPTFLGAHAIPPEFRDKREEYVNFLIDKAIPLIASKKTCEVLRCILRKWLFYTK